MPDPYTPAELEAGAKALFGRHETEQAWSWWVEHHPELAEGARRAAAAVLDAAAPLIAARVAEEIAQAIEADNNYVDAAADGMAFAAELARAHATIEEDTHGPAD